MAAERGHMKAGWHSKLHALGAVYAENGDLIASAENLALIRAAPELLERVVQQRHHRATAAPARRLAGRRQLNPVLETLHAHLQEQPYDINAVAKGMGTKER